MTQAAATQAAVAVAATLAAGGCLRSTSYPCDRDEQCVFGVQGTCEDVGYCAFPDDGCPSGRRFSEGAGPWADQCVAAVADAGVDGPATDARPDARPDAAIDATTDAAVDGGVVSGCIDPGNGTTFPNGAPCQGWGTPFSDNASIQNSGGRLIITPVPNEAAANAGCAHVPVLFGAGGFLADVERVLGGTSSRTRLELSGTGLSIGAENGQVVARAGATLVGARPYDPLATRWWRLRPVAGGVGFDTSADGQTWSQFAWTATTPPVTAALRVTADTPNAEPMPGNARFQGVNVCP